MSIEVFKSKTKILIKAITYLLICSIIYNNIFFDNFLYSILIFIFWVSFNYIIGLYHIDYYFNKSNLLISIFKISLSTIFLYSSILTHDYTITSTKEKLL